MDRDALESDAMLGLVYAARAYDPSRGATFATYAQQRIVGTMLDGLRNRTGGRGQYRKLRRMLSLSMPLCQGDGRIAALQDTLADRQEPVELHLERKEHIQWLMSELKPITGLMVRQFYFEGMTQQQIGIALGITPATVSHRLKAARQKMRKRACLH